MILRSTEWDGPMPSPGDVVQLDEHLVAVVASVAAGPGPGQYRIDCRPARLVRWQPA